MTDREPIPFGVVDAHLIRPDIVTDYTFDLQRYKFHYILTLPIPFTLWTPNKFTGIHCSPVDTRLFTAFHSQYIHFVHSWESFITFCSLTFWSSRYWRISLDYVSFYCVCTLRCIVDLIYSYGSIHLLMLLLWPPQFDSWPHLILHIHSMTFTISFRLIWPAVVVTIVGVWTTCIYPFPYSFDLPHSIQSGGSYIPYTLRDITMMRYSDGNLLLYCVDPVTFVSKPY